MTLAPALCETLDRLAPVMRVASGDWWIIASAAAALHGVDGVDVRDVDVMVMPEDTQRVLAPLGLTPLPGEADGRFRSATFTPWHGAPLTVEFMAGFDLRESGGWRPVSFATRERIDWGEDSLFVPSLPELKTLFTRFGRAKDRERISLIERHLAAD